MGDMLSQAEIEALLGGGPSSDNEENDHGAGNADAGSGIGADAGMNAGANSGTNDADASDSAKIEANDVFTSEEIDALGEVGNISMGNSATTMFALLNRKVNITTPEVSVSTLKEIADTYSIPMVVVKVEYTDGLLGSNLLILKESDVMVITDLMMGGEGIDVQGELTDLHLSAISEAMNQMIGNSSTSLSNVLETQIDISPPEAVSVKTSNADSLEKIMGLESDQQVAVVSFHMTVENLLDTKIMQILPLQFAKEMISKLVNANKPNEEEVDIRTAPQTAAPQQPQYVQPQPEPQYVPVQQPMYAPPPTPRQAPVVNVQPANFQPFDDEQLVFDRKNIGLVMDVTLEVSVELGRTHRLIKDILEFGQGSIIELDRLAGEPVDILVNGKAIAKGEVVVIDESFGVRVTDIIHPSKRL